MSEVAAVAACPPTLTERFLIVRLGGEAYGVQVLKVREIVPLQRITPVPQAPAFLTGVMNLRGRVIAVVDLRQTFNLPVVNGERSCTVIVELQRGAERVAVGLSVDSVEEVLRVPVGEIEPPPHLAQHDVPRLILGLAKVRGEVTTLLDIAHVIAMTLPRPTCNRR